MNRDESISICRAIAIVCMVVGHSWIKSPIEVCVNLFDMTLFYLVSGYCFNPQYLNNALEFLKKRIKGLWIPYVKWGVISVLLHNFFLRISVYSVDVDGATIQYWDFYELLKRIGGCLIFGVGPDGFLGGYWFLKDMFFAVMIAFAFLWFLKKSRNAALIVCVGLLMFSLLKLHYKIEIPYVHTSTLLSASIFCIGCFVKQKKIVKIIVEHTNYCVYLSAISFFLLLLGYHFYPLKMSILYLDEGIETYLLVFFLYSTIASFAILIICKIITTDYNNVFFKRIMIFIGDNTLSILTFHMLAFKLINYVIFQIYNLPVYTIGLYPTNIDYASNCWWIIYTSTGVAVPLAFVGIKKWVIQQRKR